MIRRMLPPLSLALALLVAVPGVHAGLLVTWDFAGAPGDQASTPPSLIAPGIIASDVTRGPGLTPNIGAHSINSRQWTTGDAPDLADYYEFSIAGAGTLALTSLEYSNRRSRVDGPLGVEVRFSTDEFNTFTPIALYGFAPDTEDVVRTIIDLSLVPGLQGVAEEVTFRIYAFGAGSGSGTYRLGSAGSPDEPPPDNPPPNVQIFGAVIPEPSSVILLGVGLVGLVVGRKRLARKAA